MNVLAILHGLYLEHRDKPLSWENGGCLLWAGKCSLAITGTDPTEEIRSQFSTETEAKRLLVANGCANIGDMARRAYPEIPVSMARAGDWVVIGNEDGSEGLGVVTGSQIAVSTMHGIGLVKLTRAKSAYRVR